LQADPLLGKILDGRYRVDSLIGEGGMATVYEGEQLTMNRRVALKVIRRDLSLEPTVVVRFRREVEAVSRLRSPHVIEFYDFGKTADDLLYIVMEFLEGRSLRTLISEGPMHVGDVISIVRQTCCALGEAHRAGVVHRDLSPDNVFLSDVPSPLAQFVKVLDFGLVKLAEGSDKFLNVTAQRTTVGTPAYIAPESVRADRQSDWRVDLYALGVIVFEMLVGQRPFTADGPMKMAMAHAQEPVPSAFARASHLPEAIDSFFQIAMAKDPDERFQDAETFANALATVLGDRRRAGP